jgi:hypothetical protein
VRVDRLVVGEDEVDDFPELWQPGVCQAFLARQDGAVNRAAGPVQAGLNKGGGGLGTVLYGADPATEGDVILSGLPAPGSQDDVNPRLVRLVGVVVAVGDIQSNVEAFDFCYNPVCSAV